MILPATNRRVAAHTREAINRRIREETEERLRYYADHPDQIEQRLSELDHEWDMERVLETNASELAVAGLGVAAAVDRRLAIVPAVIMGFLFQHALQGWCPPVPLFRRQGFRTQAEIEVERYALKMLRGDFGQPPDGAREQRASAALQAVLRRTPATGARP